MNRFRLLFGCFGLLACLGSALAQRYTAPQPSNSLGEAPVKSATAPASLFGGASKSLLSSQPTIRQANATSTEPMLAPTVVSGQPTAMPYDMGTLSVQPQQGVPGVVYSPWVGAADCCGPVGANGPVTYEGYLRTGPTLISGGGELSAIIKTFGWNVQGGTRSLLFNTTGDAAWALDLGIGYTKNEGRGLSRTTDVLLSELKFGVPSNTGTQRFGAQFLNRTSLNFGIGRDYFLNGPGVVGLEQFGNARFGWDVGGRWGTSSIGLIPENDPAGYRHRQSVYHGVSVGSHLNWEIPFHSWTFLAGGRLEWSYYWMNTIPPNDSDIRDVNILMMFGVRF